MSLSRFARVFKNKYGAYCLIKKFSDVRSSRWRNLFMLPDCGSLVYGISKIKVPLSHHKGRANRLRHSDPSRPGHPCK